MEVLVGTEDGLFLIEANGDQHRVLDGAVRHVVGADEGSVALLADGSLWSIDGTDAAEFDDLVALKPSTLLLDDDVVWLGTAGAHLYRVEAEDSKRMEAFEVIEGRDAWYTPWGAPPDVRSIDIDDDGTLYVAVHVGGILRSTDSGRTWAQTLDIDLDVHQVSTVPEYAQTVVAACAAGLALTTDRGDTWEIDTAGLHATYARAVAVAGDTIVLSVSDGPGGAQSALYRRPLDGESFLPCRSGLPEWFAGNVDTHCLAAWDEFVVAGTPDGGVYVSNDTGVTWRQRAAALPPIRAIAIP